MGFDVLSKDNAEKLRLAINNDSEFSLASRLATYNLSVSIGMGPFDKTIMFEVHCGKVISIDHQPKIIPDIAVKCSEEFWGKFLQPVREPFFCALYPARMIGQIMILGSEELLSAYIWPITRMFDLFHHLQNDTVLPKEAHEVKAGTHEPVVGRYVYIDVDGISYRVYYEESGQGIPLVCQHSAGADGKQYRHIQNDPEIISKYRVITYDMPYHGKSLPPVNEEWWANDYKLTKEWFIKFNREFYKTLGLSKAVFLGLSMGGTFALDLAVYAPDMYRAVVGIDSGLYQGNGDIVGGKVASYDRHPRINAMDSSPVINQQFCCPSVPSAGKWEASWSYAQGGPGILAGDAYYFSFEHDVRETLADVDTSRCAIYVLNGQYDPLTGFKEIDEIIDKNPGVKGVKMENIGHFGIVEHYPGVRKHLVPILNEIAGLYD